LGEINNPFNPPFFSGAEKYSEAELSVVFGEAEHSKGPCPFTRKSLDGFGANSDKILVDSDLLSEAISGPGESEGRSSAVLSYIEQVNRTERKLPTAKHFKKFRAKSVDACKNKNSTFAFWKKDAPNTILFKAFKCKSWRCKGGCASKIQHRDYTRIMEGIAAHPGQYFFAVLTFNPKDYKNYEHAYTSISENSNALLRRMTKDFGVISWVQVTEQHKSKWPHVNFLFKFENEFINNEEDCEKFRARWLVKNAYECGFGKRVSCDLVKGSCEKIANYISKTGMENSDRVASEVTKLSQLPISAPIGFRRLRSSTRFLPKIKKGTGEYTGVILKGQNIEILKKIPEDVLIESMAIHTGGELIENISFVDDIVAPNVFSLFAKKPSKDSPVKGQGPSECSASPRTTLSEASLYFSAPLKNASQDICSSA
jgi:hypothetical protein